MVVGSLCRCGLERCLREASGDANGGGGGRGMTSLGISHRRFFASVIRILKVSSSS